MESAYVNLTSLEESIVAELEQIAIIDCHEHLPLEQDRVARPVDVMTLFSHYCVGDMRVAGLSNQQIDFCLNPAEPLDQRWSLFKPYYEQIRYSSYARAAHIAMEKFYGFSSLTDLSVVQVTERIKAANQPGLYARVLSEACNIRTALNQNMPLEAETDSLLTKVIWLPERPNSWNRLASRYARANEEPCETLEQLEAVVRGFVDRVKIKGGVGIKQFVMPFAADDRDAARSVFDALRTDREKVMDEINPLSAFVMDVAADQAAKNDLVFCLHTGYWGDFRKLDPSHAIPFIERHKDTRFDLYHAGYPYVRQAIMLGKGFANVWLNLCWTYIISQKFAQDTLEEILEMVPVNKVLGFGGDYSVVEKIYGHLIMARESIARVLALKIRQGYMTFDQAIQVAERILKTNAEQLYRI